MPERDYGTILRCPCGYSGPFYLWKPTTKYPGSVRCPECLKEYKPKDEGDAQ